VCFCVKIWKSYFCTAIWLLRISAVLSFVQSRLGYMCSEFYFMPTWCARWWCRPNMKCAIPTSAARSQLYKLSYMCYHLCGSLAIHQYCHCHVWLVWQLSLTTDNSVAQEPQFDGLLQLRWLTVSLTVAVLRWSTLTDSGCNHCNSIMQVVMKTTCTAYAAVPQQRMLSCQVEMSLNDSLNDIYIDEWQSPRYTVRTTTTDCYSVTVKLQLLPIQADGDSQCSAVAVFSTPVTYFNSHGTTENHAAMARPLQCRALLQSWQ